MIKSGSVFGISDRFQPHLNSRLSTRYSPVRHFTRPERTFTFDLHVLSTPPAFNLSQNQTLQLIENNQLAHISMG